MQTIIYILTFLNGVLLFTIHSNSKIYLRLIQNLTKDQIDQERNITRCLAKIACLEIDVTSLKFDKKDK